MPLDLVLFDVDGTLVDSQAMIVSTFNGAFAACGLPSPGDEAARSIIGLNLDEAMTKLTGGDPTAPIAALVDAYRAVFVAAGHDFKRTAPLFEGTRAALEALASKDDTLLGVVTGKSRKGLDSVLDAHDLGRLFAVVRTGDDGPSKPHPFMVLDAIDAVGGSPERTVVVGDTSFDIEMGRAARALTLGVLWGYHPRETLTASGADDLVGSFAEVPGKVAGLLGGRR